MDTITIAKYTKSDFETYYSLVQEDNVMRYVSGKGLQVEEARLKFDSILEVNAQDDEIGYFKIYNNEHKFIGDCKIEWYKHDRSKLEIGYLLKEKFWRRGYGTMVCTKLLHLADKSYPTVDLIGIIDPDNLASKRLLEKFGFKSFFCGVEDGIPTEKLIRKV